MLVKLRVKMRVIARKSVWI